MSTSGPTPQKPKKSRPKTPPRIDIKVSWCKGCGLCVEYCNRGVLEMNGTKPAVVQAERCTRCLQCEAICPDFAIRIEDDTPEGQ
jgi:2-oxoglutarate ferredoxin oxidoreductase subunit delta